MRQFELENKKDTPHRTMDAADPGSILSFGRFGGTSGCKPGFAGAASGIGSILNRFFPVGSGTDFCGGKRMEYAAFVYALSLYGIFSGICVCRSRIASLSGPVVWIGAVFLSQLFYRGFRNGRYAAGSDFLWLAGIGNITVLLLGGCTGMGGVFSSVYVVFWERTTFCTGAVRQGLLDAFRDCCSNFVCGNLRRYDFDSMAVQTDMDVTRKRVGT